MLPNGEVVPLSQLERWASERPPAGLHDEGRLEDANVRGRGTWC